MVMTGFLPTHSIETPMDEEKAQGKAEIMRNRVVEAPHRDLLWTLLQVRPNTAQNTEVINSVLPQPGTSGRDLLMSYPDLVRQIVQRRSATAFTGVNKDWLLQQMEAQAGMYQAPRLLDPAGINYPSQSLPRVAMDDLELFIDWTRGVIEKIFDSIFVSTDDASEHIMLEAVNFDVPTERPLKVTVVTSETESVYKFAIPWYGRQVIKHDPQAFIMLAMLSITKDIEEA